MRWVGAWLVSMTLNASAVCAVELQGTVNWAQRSELGTLVSGVVVVIPVVTGQRVGKGEELLRLDDRGFQAQVSKSKAQLAGAKVRYDEAQREEERAAELYERTVLSDHERQLSAIAYQESAAALQVARASLTQARLDLEHSRITAPYDAIVVRIDAAPGKTIISELQSEPLLVIAAAGLMLARTTIGAGQLTDFAAGAVAQVRIRDRWIAGEVTAVGLEPVVQGDEGPLYELDVSFSLPSDLRLHVGEPATIKIGD